MLPAQRMKLHLSKKDLPTRVFPSGKKDGSMPEKTRKMIRFADFTKRASGAAAADSQQSPAGPAARRLPPDVTHTPTELEDTAGLAPGAARELLHDCYEKARYSKSGCTAQETAEVKKAASML